MIVGAFEPLASGARTETAYRALFTTLTIVLHRRDRNLQPLAGRQAENHEMRARR